MLFHTIPFLVLFICIVVGFAFFKQSNGRKNLLLLASYIFYGWWSPAFVLLIIYSTIVDYFIGRKIFNSSDARVRKKWLVISLCANLLVLGFFKYANFFRDSAVWLANQFGTEWSYSHLNIILPVGISFYTFQTISYSVDIYRREISPAKSFRDFALFVGFFPQLIAGPIVRAKDFIPQLCHRPSLNFTQTNVVLFLRGLAKKVLIAENIAPFVDRVFENPEAWPSVVIWIAVVCFAVQIYCDFSGYSEMAIAIAAMLGYTLCRNFDRPYFSMDPSEFWRKWHISLSSWLRDYLYIPLGGNRGSNLFIVRNLCITMLLGGLWHGASWNFILWGAIHGVILTVHRYYSKFTPLSDRLRNTWIYKGMAMILMQYCVLVTWITFRIESFPSMWVALKKFVLFDFNLSLGGLGLGSMQIFSTFSFLGVFALLHVLGRLGVGVDSLMLKQKRIGFCLCMFFIGVVSVFFWPSEETPFIYFQF